MDKKKTGPKKKGAPKLNDLDVKQRRLAILKQKHCDAVALHIVGKLIDSPVEEDVFLQCLKYLNQCHFQDVIEERAISKMCGYPLCKNLIPDMPVKKYHISVKNNKVYDITERKNYCSNFCYSAGNHIKAQMLTSPLWYRDQETIPNFQLLKKDVKGTPGEEIDQGILRVPKETDPEFTSVSQFTQELVNELPDDYINDENENDTDEEITTNINKLSISSEKTNIVTDDFKPSTSKQEFIVENHTSNQKIESSTDSTSGNTNFYKEENFFYSKMFAPSLADILNENAKYFESIDNKMEKNDIEENRNQMKESDKNVSEENNTVVEPVLKGILSKTCKGKMKKSVKFAFDQMTDYLNHTDNIDNTETTRIFKKPCVPKHLVKNNETNNKEKKSDNQSESRFKNSATYARAKNLSKVDIPRRQPNAALQEHLGKCINSEEKVQNTDENSNTNLDNKDKLNMDSNNKENKIYNNNNTEQNINEEHIKHLSQNSLINKPVIEHKSVIISNKNSDTKPDLEKEKRKSRFKNSATYARAKHLSKVEIPKEQPKVVFQEHVEKCIKEWCTIETMIYLYGEEKVQNIISDKKFKQYLNCKKNTEEEERRKRQYDSLCKRLNLMELADKQYDENVKRNEKKPLPNYEQLKQEAETMDLRVKAFYSGCFEVYEEEADESETEEQESPAVIKGPPAVLPLVDSKDYDPIRKKIFLSSLTRTIPNICEIFQLPSPNLLMIDLKELVSTFKFGANNIIFKTAEWPLVTFLLLKMISIKKTEFVELLSKDKVQNYISSILNPLKINKDDFYSNVLKIIDINTVLQDYLNKNNDC